ncbi:hypothetical protein [Rubrivirga sp.]|uniref:hypothetical protein n=1 Tax=Rubrivirga sp. TaxID=1885344 RepID=UPI003B52F7C7
MIQKIMAFSVLGCVALSWVPWTTAVARYLRSQRDVAEPDRKGSLGIYGDYLRGTLDRKTRNYVHPTVALLALAAALFVLFAFSSAFAFSGRLEG